MRISVCYRSESNNLKKLASKLLDQIVRKKNHKVKSPKASDGCACNQNFSWGAASDCFSRSRKHPSSTYSLWKHETDAGFHSNTYECVLGSSKCIESIIRADLSLFGNDGERLERHNRYAIIFGNYNSGKTLTLNSYVSANVQGPRICTHLNTSISDEAPSTSQAVEAYVYGRALTSPAIIETFHRHSRDRSSTLFDCIRMAAKSILDNNGFVSEISSEVRNGSVSLNKFRDMFIERALERNSIGLEVEDLPDVPACMISVGDSKTIYRDKRLNGFERSFAVAHEFAHFSFRDKSYIDVRFDEGDGDTHSYQEYRSDQFANILLRSIEGIFVALGGKPAQRDYTTGMLDLAAGKRPLKRNPVKRAVRTAVISSDEAFTSRSAMSASSPT